MSETGATAEQIEAAVERRWPADLRRQRGDMDYHVDLSRTRFEHAARYLVPTGMVIAAEADVLSPEDRAAIGRAAEAFEAHAEYLAAIWAGTVTTAITERADDAWDSVTPADVAALRRLAGAGA